MVKVYSIGATRELILDMVVVCEPVPKARARVRKGQGGYTPQRNLTAERSMEWHMKKKMNLEEPARGPLFVECHFHLGNKRRVDIDNLWKLVSDAGNGIVWRDDSQIVSLYLHKHIVLGYEPKTSLQVWKLAEAKP